MAKVEFLVLHSDKGSGLIIVSSLMPTGDTTTLYFSPTTEPLHQSTTTRQEAGRKWGYKEQTPTSQQDAH